MLPQRRLLLLLVATLAALQTGRAVFLDAPPCLKDYPKWLDEFQAMVSGSPLFQEGQAAAQAAADPAKFRREVTRFCFNVSRYAERSLEQPLQQTKRPHQFSLACNSSKYADVFTGEPRPPNNTARIVWASPFVSELPLLRLRLYTYHDLVDYFVIAESIRSQHSHTIRTLVYERTKEFFADFQDKIIHFILDSSRQFHDLNHTFSDTITQGHSWKGEEHERQKVARFIEKRMSWLKDDDIVVYGDIDELPDEDYLFQLKHCIMRPSLGMPLSSHAVFHFNSYRLLFKTDFPASYASPYSFIFPQFWQYGYIRQHRPGGLRNGDVNPHPSEPGGVHLRGYPFMPSWYMKNIGTAEFGPLGLFGNPLHSDPKGWMAQMQTHVMPRAPHPKCVAAKYPLYKPVLLKVPWLMALNPQAFPEYFLCRAQAYYETLEEYADCGKHPA